MNGMYKNIILSSYPLKERKNDCLYLPFTSWIPQLNIIDSKNSNKLNITIGGRTEEVLCNLQVHTFSQKTNSEEIELVEGGIIYNSKLYEANNIILEEIPGKEVISVSAQSHHNDEKIIFHSTNNDTTIFSKGLVSFSGNEDFCLKSCFYENIQVEYKSAIGKPDKETNFLYLPNITTRPYVSPFRRLNYLAEDQKLLNIFIREWSEDITQDNLNYFLEKNNSRKGDMLFSREKNEFGEKCFDKWKERDYYSSEDYERLWL